MNAVLDLFNVLHEPTAVFERLREKPRWFLPAVVVIIVLSVIALLMKPFYIAAFQGAAASLTPEQAARAPSAATQATIGLAFVPVGVLLSLVIGAGLLWVMTAVTGTEGRYKVLLSVLSHAYMTYVLFSIVGAAVLLLRGAQSVTSMADLRPALGLDLVIPGAGPALATFLNGINPFSIWGVWLTGLGVSVTHRTSRSSGIMIAALAFLVGLGISAALALLQGGGAR